MKTTFPKPNHIRVLAGIILFPWSLLILVSAATSKYYESVDKWFENPDHQFIVTVALAVVLLVVGLRIWLRKWW